jgi:hypothetical protein
MNCAQEDQVALKVQNFAELEINQLNAKAIT